MQLILILIWVSFIFLLSTVEFLDSMNYFFLSISILYITYLYNQKKIINLSLRITILLLIIPNIIFWYIFFVYNNFLCITPISEELLISIFFIYTYLLIYLFWNYLICMIIVKYVFFMF